MTKKLFLYVVSALIFSWPVQAAVTFLPDYEEGKFEFEGGINQDDQLCQRAKDSSGNALYHHAPGAEPKCPNNQVYDDHCPHGDDGKDWITKCHCPYSWVKCSAPLTGNGLQCIDSNGVFYESCCSGGCSEGGSTIPCSSYSETIERSYTNDCGSTCYICRLKSECTTYCYENEIPIEVGGVNDEDGLPCLRCDPKGPCDDVICPDDKICQEGDCLCPPGQCCPKCDDGYTCNNGTCEELPPDDPCADVNCPDNKICKEGDCICPPGQCCPKCGDGYTCNNGTCEELPPDDPCADITCVDGKICKEGKCLCPPGQCCPKCGDGYTCNNGTCEELPPDDPCSNSSCPTAVNCGSAGCEIYSKPTTCCPSSVCTHCKPASEGGGSCLPTAKQWCYLNGYRYINCHSSQAIIVCPCDHAYSICTDMPKD